METFLDPDHIPAHHHDRQELPPIHSPTPTTSLKQPKHPTELKKIHSKMTPLELQCAVANELKTCNDLPEEVPLSQTITKILDRIHPSAQAHVASDFLSARRAIASGTVVKTASDREKYWNHWVSYAKTCKINPWLLGIDQLELEIIVSGFAARIRAGNYGRGNQVTVSTVQNGLSAITKTLELAGKSSPLYKEGTDKYKTTIQRLIEGYR